MKATVVVNRGQMGHGHDELGARIRGLDRMVFYNSGVLTLVEG